MDAAGNRLAAPSTESPTPNTTNQLAQLNGTRYRYDGAGNLIERQQPNGERLTLGYDGANRLVHLIHASELGYTREATYRYDGLGRRISKTVRHTNGTTATTHYGWDGDRIVREETENQRTTVVYEPGSFVPMLRIDDTQQGQVLSAYITDALGTPMQLVTPNGQPRWLAEPDDWAAVKNQRAVRNLTQPIRFQGQWHDEEPGLYYNRHRYYDPQQGRYISQDPIGLRGGTNLYGYVTNPTGMVDPLGLYGFLGADFSNLTGSTTSCSQGGVPKRFQDILEQGNIDFCANISEAENMSFKDWVAAVQTNGKWDYKNELNDLGIDSTLLDDFGNYHFGAVAGTYGFNLESSMYGAGANQVIRQGGGTPSDLSAATGLMWITTGGYLFPDFATKIMTNSGFTWGDNPGDSVNIMNGWEYYNECK